MSTLTDDRPVCPSRRVALVAAVVTVVGGWLGCDRSPAPTTRPATATPAATSTQPTATELANVREFVQKQATEPVVPTLPPGHPPLPAMTTPAPPTQMLPPASSPANPPTSRLHYTAPAAWQQEPVRPGMRVGQYRLPRADGDADDGELTVFYFGPGGGGGLEANIARWRGQLATADGSPLPDDAVVRQSLEANGLKITFVTATGRFQGMAMQPGSPAPASKADYTLMAAVVETPDGPWFFKAVGPQQTMSAQQPSFLDFLKSMHLE